MQIFVDADAVDYKLISICHKGDIVVSQDYGVAAMALGKNAGDHGGHPVVRRQHDVVNVFLFLGELAAYGVSTGVVGTCLLYTSMR